MVHFTIKMLLFCFDFRDNWIDQCKTILSIFVFQTQIKSKPKSPNVHIRKGVVLSFVAASLIVLLTFYLFGHSNLLRRTHRINIIATIAPTTIQIMTMENRIKTIEEQNSQEVKIISEEEHARRVDHLRQHHQNHIRWYLEYDHGETWSRP